MDRHTEIELEDTKSDLVKAVKKLDVTNPPAVKRDLPKIQEMIDRIDNITRELT